MTETPEPQRQWLVTLSMPIEAGDRAQAAAGFWEYVKNLGADELPVFVSPMTDEMAMLAYVGGVESDQDPEEE
ncbi:hypothetical protein [Stackebrandtia albiflava]|uniref:hypothetical protein n=1 Tax=Stackebrandtia albiflava TaxID=406432 RepID=UPI0011BF85C2|nr:hypothetical protein [Stackebrandtia albiflava]